MTDKVASPLTVSIIENKRLKEELQAKDAEIAKLRDALEMIEAIMCDKALCGHFLPEEIRTEIHKALGKDGK